MKTAAVHVAMDTPRALLLGAPLAASLVAAAALVTGRAPTEAVFPAGLLLAVPLGAYAVTRLRGDVLLPLAVESAALALAYLTLVGKCRADRCAETLVAFDGLHVGAFAAALAALMALVASLFAPALRPGMRAGVAAAGLAALALGALTGAWALR